MVPAHATIEPQIVVNVPQPPTAPAQLKPLASASTAKNETSHPLAGVEAAEVARTKATETANASNYIDAVAVYDFVPGRVYHVYTSPDFLTAISLRPGEKLLSKAAADTARWQIGDTLAGSDASQTTLVVIKPSKADLHTNLIVTTNERTYFLDLESRAGDQYQNAVRWDYPQELITTTVNKTAQMNRERQETALSGVNLENLNYDYRIETQEGSEPSWLPREVFDDGKKTYINFPAELGTMEAPPLYIRTIDGQADLVNYRVKGHFYVVDRLFERAELRLGHDPQTVVAIENKRRVKASFWSW
jgi:type IV secretion system protein VirB9